MNDIFLATTSLVEQDLKFCWCLSRSIVVICHNPETEKCGQKKNRQFYENIPNFGTTSYRNICSSLLGTVSWEERIQGHQVKTFQTGVECRASPSMESASPQRPDLPRFLKRSFLHSWKCVFTVVSCPLSDWKREDNLVQLPPGAGCICQRSFSHSKVTDPLPLHVYNYHMVTLTRMNFVWWYFETGQRRILMQTLKATLVLRYMGLTPSCDCDWHCRCLLRRWKFARSEKTAKSDNLTHNLKPKAGSICPSQDKLKTTTALKRKVSLI